MGEQDITDCTTAFCIILLNKLLTLCSCNSSSGEGYNTTDYLIQGK